MIYCRYDKSLGQVLGGRLSPLPKESKAPGDYFVHRYGMAEARILDAIG